jgi:hypothetical protein
MKIVSPAGPGLTDTRTLFDAFPSTVIATVHSPSPSARGKRQKRQRRQKRAPEPLSPVRRRRAP